MRKLVLLLCAACLLVGALGGCAASDGKTSAAQNDPSAASQAAQADGASGADAADFQAALQSDQAISAQDWAQLNSQPILVDASGTDGVDVDLTVLNSNMVYSQVYQMMYSPEDFVGKVIRMKGTLSYYQDPNTKQEYFACIIADAAACCAQGIEFDLAGDYTYPQDYPDLGEELTVQGVFSTYMEGSVMYVTLKDAVMIDQ